MAKFVYKAKKTPTETIEGSIEAENKIAAIQKISAQGLHLLSLDEYMDSARSKKGLRNVRKLRLKDITQFTRQLSDLLDSGVTVAKALDIIYQQSDNRRLREITVDIRDYCMDGNSLSSAFERHRGVFSNVFISLIKSGETGGALVNVLNRLADFFDKQLDIQTKVKSALAYPILMALVGGLTIGVLFTFVIPKMITMFGDLGQALPLPTLILIRVHGIFQNYWWFVLMVALALIVLLRRLYKTKAGRRTLDKAIIDLPVFGDFTKKIEIARFARTLSTLLHNGVPILESLYVVSETIDNAVIKGEVLKAADYVKQGSGLARGFSGSITMPPLVTNMIAIGEETGKVDSSLMKVAESYERESDAAIKVMLSLLEPLMILLLGGVVGFIVIAMLLPIFEINFMAR